MVLTDKEWIQYKKDKTRFKNLLKQYRDELIDTYFFRFGGNIVNVIEKIDNAIYIINMGLSVKI